MTAPAAETSLWGALTDALAEMEALVLDDPRIDDDVVRAEGVRYLTRLLAGGIPMTMECADPDYPQLVQFLSSKIQFGLPAADCRYHWAAVRGGETYRIFGTRGTCRIFDVETRRDHTAHLAKWELFDRANEFEVGPDGEIEVILSSEEQEGNWIRLPDEPGSIIVREYYYDWLTEEPARLDIERVGAAYPPPPLRPEAVADGIDLLTDWVRQVPAACRAVVESHYAAPDDGLVFAPLDFGWADLQYGKGHFRCEPGEAVILELVPPDAEYWGVQLTSHFWEAWEWNRRQTSINGHQAVLDDDGVFRAVISQSDPGVPNWLDPSGHGAGLIAARYFKAKEVTEPTLRTVPLASLRDELPDSTPTVSPEERQRFLRDRHLSVRRRGCD